MTYIRVKLSTTAPVSTANVVVVREQSRSTASSEGTTARRKRSESLASRLEAKALERNPELAGAFESERKRLAPLARTSEGGETLASLRSAAGLTQSQLAAKAGINQPNISSAEAGMRGNPTLDTMKALCAALNCDMNTLTIAYYNSAKEYSDLVEKQCERATEVAKDSSRLSA